MKEKGSLHRASPPPHEVEALLDDSVAAKQYVIRAAETDITEHIVDLAGIDFEALQEKFATGRQRTEAERLKGLVSSRLVTMVRLNPARVDYMERFQKLIDEYNAGSINT